MGVKCPCMKQARLVTVFVSVKTRSKHHETDEIFLVYQETDPGRCSLEMRSDPYSLNRAFTIVVVIEFQFQCSYKIVFTPKLIPAFDE
jgi:hypothetical protein